MVACYSCCALLSLGLPAVCLRALGVGCGESLLWILLWLQPKTIGLPAQLRHRTYFHLTPDLCPLQTFASVCPVFSSQCDTEETPVSQRSLWFMAELHHQAQPKLRRRRGFRVRGRLNAAGPAQWRRLSSARITCFYSDSQNCVKG